MSFRTPLHPYLRDNYNSQYISLLLSQAVCRVCTVNSDPYALELCCYPGCMSPQKCQDVCTKMGFVKVAMVEAEMSMKSRKQFRMGHVACHRAVM